MLAPVSLVLLNRTRYRINCLKEYTEVVGCYDNDNDDGKELVGQVLTFLVYLYLLLAVMLCRRAINNFNLNHLFVLAVCMCDNEPMNEACTNNLT